MNDIKFKLCHTCGLTKDLTDFYTDNRNKRDGKQSKCKSCTKKYSEENKERIVEYKKAYHIKNKQNDDYIAKREDWYQENREDQLIYKHNWYELNKVEHSKKRNLYYEVHKKEIAKQKNTYEKNKRLSDPKHRLDQNISNQIRNALKTNKDGRPWESIVGYTKKELCAHFESLFTEGINWNNHGKGKNKWHIGHIIPKCAFYYKTANDYQVKKCWALSNLIPQWEVDNFKKIATIKNYHCEQISI